MKGKVNVMIEFDLLKSLEESLRLIRELSVPALICRTDFEVIAANTAAQRDYPGLTLPDGIKTLLEEHGLDKLRLELESAGALSISDMVAFEDVKLVLSPVKSGELLAICVFFDRADALLCTTPLKYKAQTADTLSGGIRSSMDAMFHVLDELVQKSDFLGMEWVAQYAEKISAQGYQALRIAANVTEYVRLQNGELSISPSAFNLTAWLEEIREAVAILGRQAGVPVHMMIPHEDCVAMLDSAHFEIAFFNVLHNAIYYTKPGSEVYIALQEASGNVEITVQDSGAGIPEEILPYVAEPYFSFAHDKAVAGAGLGLTLTKRILTAHCGEFSITSESGEGTRVKLCLPGRDYSAPLILAQSEQSYQNSRDRFSSLYIGLAGIAASPCGNGG